MFAAAEMSDITEPFSADAVTDDSCVAPYIEIAPLARDTDDSATTEYDDGVDWFAEVKQEMLEDIKQEPDDVCSTCYYIINYCICTLEWLFCCARIISLFVFLKVMLLCNLCYLYSLVKMDCGVLFYLV